MLCYKCYHISSKWLARLTILPASGYKIGPGREISPVQLEI